MNEQKKNCIACGRELPANKEYFKYSRKEDDHLSKICIACYAKAEAKKDENVPLCRYNRGVECDCHDFKKCSNCGWSKEGHIARLRGYSSGIMTKCEIERNERVTAKKAMLRVSKRSEKDAEKLMIDTMDGFTIALPRKAIEDLFEKFREVNANDRT